MANSNRKLPLWSKIIIIVLVLLIIGFIVFASIDVNRKIHYWTLYSESEHLERVTKGVEERYIENKYNHPEYNYITDYSIYPLYDENEELSFFLVEFEPYGFACINISRDYSWLMSKFGLFGMYTRFEIFSHNPWYRYRVYDDDVANSDPNWLNGYFEEEYAVVISENVYYEVNENGTRKPYNNSYYKVAGIPENERKYMLEVKIKDDIRYIPAVKRGDKWLNLVSMEEFDLSQFPMDENYPHSGIWFTIKADGNL